MHREDGDGSSGQSGEGGNRADREGEGESRMCELEA